MSIQKYKRDFFKEAHQLLKQQGYKNYIQSLLPSGKWQGGEYVVLNPTRNDTKPSSFSINGSTGKWADFATDKAGNDLIGLTAYVKSVSPIEACYHIGVPRLDQTNSQTITSENSKESNMKINRSSIEELPSISQEILDELTALTEERREPTEEVLAQEPPQITAADTHYHSKREFGCFPSVFFPYKNSLSVTVGHIARWDIKTEGGETKKEVRPYIYDFEKKKWVSKFFGSHPKNSRPLYNLPQILERKDATILIVEGEKTAEAAKLLFPELVATTSSGGASSTHKTEWFWLQGRDIIIAPDDGKAGSQYLEQVIKTLTKHGVDNVKILEPRTLGDYIVKNGSYIQRTDPLPHGYDLADSLAEGWTQELIQQAQLDKQFYPFFKERRGQLIIKTELRQNEEVYEFGSKTYKLTPAGLYIQYFVQATAGDLANDPQYGEHDHILAMKEAWRPLCGYLKPTYKVTAIDNSWGMLVKFKDLESLEREVFLKRTDWLGEKGAVEILQDRGLQLIGLKQKDLDPINEYLNKFTPESQAIGVDKVGWQGDTEAYMMPFVNDPRNNYLVKQEQQKIEYILQQRSSVSRKLRKKGTLAKWKSTVGEVCRGNHLHSFAMIVSLTAPILYLLKEEGFIIHYVGSTSVGKSTILEVPQSIWGLEEIGTFRATDNNLEGVCKVSNDGMILLDEMGEVEADALSKIVYMISNGVTKGRSDKSGNAKATTHFTVIAQSTGEIGLEAKLAEKRIQAKGGQLIRMPELDADRGKGLNTFDILKLNPDTGNIFEDGKTQAEYLKTHAQENCGVVIDGFMKELVKDIESYIRGVKNLKAEWIKNLKATKGNAEIDRMIKRFSTIYATGVIASIMGVIPHTKEEANESVTTMFDNWLNRRGGDAPYELKAITSNIYKLCIENQYSRFCNAHSGDRDKQTFIKDKAGYFSEEVKLLSSEINKYGEEEKKYKYTLKEFWIHTQVFERDILKGRDKNIFYPLLVKAGYIEKGKDGQTAQKRRPKHGMSERFIVIPAPILFGEVEDEELNTEDQKKNGIIENGQYHPVNDCA